VLEDSAPDHPALLEGLLVLINISYVDDVEVFKTCLDYWHTFVSDIFNSICAPMAAMPPGEFSFQPVSPGNQRRTLYEGILSKLRALMINRMAKPEVRPCRTH
jgi:exportin-1